MSYIEHELTPGERIVLLGRVSWWTMVPRTLLALGVLVVVAGWLGASSMLRQSALPALRAAQ